MNTNIQVQSKPNWITSTVMESNILSGESLVIPLAINTDDLPMGNLYKTKIIISDYTNLHDLYIEQNDLIEFIPDLSTLLNLSEYNFYNNSHLGHNICVS